MNIKPSPEQVREWVRTTQLEPHGEGWSREQRIAELAASWGAEQAQQTTEPEAWNQAQVCTWIGNQLMTHPSMFERSEVCKFVRGLGRNVVLRSMFPKPQAQQTTVEEPKLPEAAMWQGRWLDQSDDAEGWSEWRAIDAIDLPRWQKRITDKPGCYEIRALHTATQMHDHFQAGVRAGMAQQSQDAKRIRQLEMFASLMDEASNLIAEIDPSILEATDGYRWPLCDELGGAALIARDEVAAMQGGRQS